MRGEGEERLEEVRAWMVEREGVVERAVAWELGEGWSGEWRRSVGRRRGLVERLARLGEEERSIQAQLGVLASLH